MKEAVRESGGTDGAAASEIGVDASLAGKKLGTDATVENDPAELPGRLTKRYRALVEVTPPFVVDKRMPQRPSKGEIMQGLLSTFCLRSVGLTKLSHFE